MVNIKLGNEEGDTADSRANPNSGSFQYSIFLFLATQFVEDTDTKVIRVGRLEWADRQTWRQEDTRVLSAAGCDYSRFRRIRFVSVRVEFESSLGFGKQSQFPAIKYNHQLSGVSSSLSPALSLSSCKIATISRRYLLSFFPHRFSFSVIQPSFAIAIDI